jgi:hypothetical protein
MQELLPVELTPGEIAPVVPITFGLTFKVKICHLKRSWEFAFTVPARTALAMMK